MSQDDKVNRESVRKLWREIAEKHAFAYNPEYINEGTLDALLAFAAVIAPRSADRAQEATGKYKFRFEGRTYYTDQRRMTVAQMLFITDGRTEGHVFQQDHDSQPRRYLDHGDKIDMTCEPWLFIDLPARM